MKAILQNYSEQLRDIGAMKKYNFIYFVVIFIPNGIALPVDAAEYELSDLQYSKIDMS